MVKIRTKGSIGKRLFICMIVFTVLTVAILWITQNFFLEPIYRNNKINEIKSAAQEMIKCADSDELEKDAERIAKEYGVCIIIESKYKTFKPISVDVVTNDCIIHRNDPRLLSDLYERALKNDTATLYLSEFGSDDVALLVAKAEHKNDTAIIMLNSVIAPVGATLETMNTLLMYVTIAMILLSLVLTLILSGIITKPIISITKGAKALAKGDYSYTFKGGGSSEIDELADILNHTKDELQKTDKLQSELIANISHDIRTPLTMISGYSQIMRDIPEENTPENLQIIIDESERLSNLVTDVLDLSKLRAGTKKMNKETLFLTELVPEVLERIEKLSGCCPITFDDGERICIEGDKTGVLQVIYNLVINAVNHTPRNGNVTVKVSRMGDYARLSVADTGEGIPPDKLKDIWERYYKADSTVRSDKGSGLGLSIVKEIMLNHNGFYGVSSTIGAGSLFWVDFPISDSPTEKNHG